MSRIAITGAAGFIGFHLVNKLIGEGHDVHCSVGLKRQNQK